MKKKMKADDLKGELKMKGSDPFLIRKHLSVFGLFVRSSLFKVIGILLLLVGIEIGLFYSKYFSDIDVGSVNILQWYLDVSKMEIVFAVAFIVITILLCLTGTEYGAKTRYTFKRLSITERATFFHQAGYNVLVYVLLWAVQLITAFVICTIYVKNIPNNELSNQVMFLEFYRNTFLHALLPQEDIALWVRNIVWVIAMAVAAADFPYRQRRGKFAMTVLVFGINVLLFWKCEIGNLYNCILTIFLAIVIIQYVLICSIFKKEGSYDA